MDSESFKAIRILALHAVDQPDWDASYRKICRWYSKEFSTPLSDVFKMSEHDVLQTYFEETFGALASNSSEEAQKKYEDLKESLITGLTEQEVAEQEEDQEEAWAKEMIDQVKEDWKDKDAEAENNPNLMDLEENFNMSSEDSISQDEEL